MIGIFDSGIGGLSVLTALRQTLPDQKMLYLADFGYCPYGDRSETEIVQRSQTIIRWMKGLGVACVVVACHTSSSVLTPCLQKSLDIPIITMLQPTIHSIIHHPHAHNWRQGIGVLATALSIQKGTIAQKLQQEGFSLPIYPIACPSLAPLIEARSWDQARVYFKQEILSFFKDHPVDAVVYGCTHYPLLEPFLQKESERMIPRIDPAQQVALRTQQWLIDTDFSQPFMHPEPSVVFYYTGDSETGKERLAHHWPTAVTAHATCLHPEKSATL